MPFALFRAANRISAADIQPHFLQRSNAHQSADRSVRCARRETIFIILLCILFWFLLVLLNFAFWLMVWGLLTKRWFFRWSPWLGSKSAISNFKKVDLPTPLGPTIAIRLDRSIPNSVLTKRGGWPSKLKLTSANKQIFKFLVPITKFHRKIKDTYYANQELVAAMVVDQESGTWQCNLLV